MNRFFTLILGLSAVVGTPDVAKAGPIVWNLSTMNFDIICCGGIPTGHQGTVTGSFTYNADTDTYLTWSIQLSGFSGTGTDGLLLTPATSSISQANYCLQNWIPGGTCGVQDFKYGFDLKSNQAGPGTGFPLADVQLAFAPQPPTDSGGTIPVAGTEGTTLLLDFPNFSSFGQVPVNGTASAAPEPAAGWLVLFAVFGLLMFSQRRRRRVSR